MPLPVLAACNKLTMQIESNPDLFVRVGQTDLITKCRAQIAEFVGAKVNEIVLVRNTSHGLNTIMRSFEWNAGDVIVTCASSGRGFMLLPIDDVQAAPRTMRCRV